MNNSEVKEKADDVPAAVVVEEPKEAEAKENNVSAETEETKTNAVADGPKIELTGTC